MTAPAQSRVQETWKASATDSTIGLRRTLAALAAVSAVLHLMMLGHGSLWLSALMAGLAFWCLLCAGRLWRESSPRVLTMIAAMNSGMLVLHLWMMLGMGAHSAAGSGSMSLTFTHHGSSETASSGILPVEHPALMVAATLIALIEVIGALWMRRGGLERRVVREGDH